MANNKKIPKQPTRVKRDKKIKQHQDFNNVIQENLNEILEVLTQKVLDLGKLKTRSLKDQTIRRTLYRKPDILLAELDAADNHICTLHAEVHLKDEEEIGYRAAEYAMMEFREFRKPVKVFILYIGNGRCKNIPSFLDGGCVKAEIKVIQINAIPAQVFLASDKPAEIILGVLSDFGGQSAETIIAAIIMQLQKLIQDQERLQKYCKQLEILSNIRNLQLQTIKQLSAMPITYDIKSDLRYQQGREQGIEQGREQGIDQGRELEAAFKTRKFVINLIEFGYEDDALIANLSDTTIEFVQSVRKELLEKKEEN